MFRIVGSNIIHQAQISYSLLLSIVGNTSGGSFKKTSRSRCCYTLKDSHLKEHSEPHQHETACFLVCVGNGLSLRTEIMPLYFSSVNATAVAASANHSVRPRTTPLQTGLPLSPIRMKQWHHSRGWHISRKAMNGGRSRTGLRSADKSQCVCGASAIEPQAVFRV